MIPMIKSLSWPLISTGSPIVDSLPITNNKVTKSHPYYTESTVVPQSPTFQQLMAARRLLCRHYYPETGWGWVIVLVGVSINSICHGLQLSFGVLISAIIRKYGVDYNDTGKCYLIQIN